MLTLYTDYLTIATWTVAVPHDEGRYLPVRSR
jgi:hypothetical protein